MATSMPLRSDFEFKSNDVEHRQTDKDDVKHQAYQARGGVDKERLTQEIKQIMNPTASTGRKIHHTSVADLPFSSIPDAAPVSGGDVPVEETVPLLQKQASSSGGMTDAHTPVVEDLSTPTAGISSKADLGSALNSTIAKGQTVYAQNVAPVVSKATAQASTVFKEKVLPQVESSLHQVEGAYKRAIAPKLQKAGSQLRHVYADKVPAQQREQIHVVQQSVGSYFGKLRGLVRRYNMQIPLIALAAFTALWLAVHLSDSKPLPSAPTIELTHRAPLQDVPGPGILDRAQMKVHTAEDAVLSSTHSIQDRIVSAFRPIQTWIWPNSIAQQQTDPLATTVDDHVIERKVHGVVLEQLDTMPIPAPSLLDSAQDKLSNLGSSARGILSGIGQAAQNHLAGAKEAVSGMGHTAQVQLAGAKDAVQQPLAGAKQAIHDGASKLQAHLTPASAMTSVPIDLNPDDHVIELKSHGSVVETLPGLGDATPSLVDQVQSTVRSTVGDVTHLKDGVLHRLEKIPVPHVDMPSMPSTGDAQQAATDLKASLLDRARGTLASIQHTVSGAIPTIKQQVSGWMGGAPAHSSGVHADVLNPEDHIVEEKLKDGGVIEKLDV